MPNETSRPTTPDAQEFAGRVALITGASRGLGAAAALALGRAGAQTLLVARTVGGLEELDDSIRAAGGPPPALVPLDLTDDGSKPINATTAKHADEKKRTPTDPLLRLAAHIHARHGRLDLLFAAAATLPPLTPVAQIHAQDWDRALALNLTANQRLIVALDPLLKRATGGRALFIGDSAAAAHKTRPFMAAYDASKVALAALVRAWGDELRGYGAAANLALPPPFRSRLRAEGWPGEDAAQLPAAEKIAEACLPLLSIAETRSGVEIPIHP